MEMVKLPSWGGLSGGSRYLQKIIRIYVDFNPHAREFLAAYPRTQGALQVDAIAGFDQQAITKLATQFGEWCWGWAKHGEPFIIGCGLGELLPGAFYFRLIDTIQQDGGELAKGRPSTGAALLGFQCHQLVAILGQQRFHYWMVG